MEEPANRRNGAFTSQNSSLSSLDYSDLTLSLPALPPSEVRGGEVRTVMNRWNEVLDETVENVLKVSYTQELVQGTLYIDFSFPSIFSCRIEEVLCLECPHPHHRIRLMGMYICKIHSFLTVLQ